MRTFKILSELVAVARLGDCLSGADTSPSVLSEISGSKTLPLGGTAPTASQRLRPPSLAGAARRVVNGEIMRKLYVGAAVARSGRLRGPAIVAVKW